MTYIPTRQGQGTSTQLISVRVQRHTIDYAENYCFNFGRFINLALVTYVHDLQTDHDITYDKYWLTRSLSVYTPYDTDGRGSVQKMVRVRCDLLDYLRMNKYRVNTAVNLACDRWRKYAKAGKVQQYNINHITKPNCVPYNVADLK